MIINIYGGPGVGKSTVASSLFAHLNRSYAGAKSVELVTEYAKDLTWEGRHATLDKQLYVTAKQFRNLSRVVDAGVDIVVTDGPMLLGCCYAQKYRPDYPQSFFAMAKDFNDMLGPSLNIVLNRTSRYVPVGRNQSEEEALEMDDAIVRMLKGWNYDYHATYPAGHDTDVFLKGLIDAKIG